MVNIALSIIYGITAAFLPVISLITWLYIFTRFFPYTKREFSKVVFLKDADKALRYIMLGMMPIFFLTGSLISAGLATIGEGLFMVLLYILDNSFPAVSEILVGISAGPIEESMKFLIAGLIFMTIHLIWRKVPIEKQKKVNRDPVKDGMIIGVFAGGSFGFLESLGYLFSHFLQISIEGFSFVVIDMIIWRFILGVFVHALYSGIASAGLGRKTFRKKVVATSLVLSTSVLLHSLNNGIGGYISYLTDLKDIPGIIVSDILQGTFLLVGIGIFIFLWKTSKKY